ncbi:MAG: CHASE domain-containing protein [Gammaproteobacteria bacterium]|nr:CHASE domain-containing protein [Gammaproteobacteria bacterium]
MSILVLAMAYIITGRLGLLLAIPPGYATAVWPASGIALAAILLYGYRLWPGVFLGSLLVNITVSFDGSDSQSVFNSIALAASVATGGSLQALLGAYLVRRYSDPELGLIDTRSVLGFLGLGGPISCLVGASWGVTTLWLYGQISHEDYLFSWVNWWVGDAIGVIIFLPLTYIFLGKPALIWRWRIVPIAIPLILSVSAVIAFFILASDSEQERIESDFQQDALVVAESLEKHWISYVENLYSIHGLLMTSEEIDSQKFSAFVSRSLERTPGIQALSWNPLIGEQQRESFEMVVRNKDHPGFQIMERNDAGEMVRAGSRPVYIVVQYIEPLQGNEKALGYDVYSNLTRKQALDIARDTAKPVATARIELVQDSSHQAGILVFLPVYRKGVIPVKLENRRRFLRGYVVGVFRMGDVLATALKDHRLSHSQVFLFDETDDQVLAAYRVTDEGSGHLLPLNVSTPIENHLTRSTALNIGGRTWRLLVTPTARYLSLHRSWSAWFVLAGGLIITGLLGTFLLILSGRQIVERRRAEELYRLNKVLSDEVAQRQNIENSLREANTRLEQLATVDYLTGMYNRRYVQDFAKQCDADLQRYQNPYSIIMFDLDKFKLINDRLGHDVGDRVLQEVSRRVAGQLRETDCLGRWGGEEFLIVAKQTQLEDSIGFAQRLCQVVSQYPVDKAGTVSISVGVAWNTGEFTLDEVIRHADQALYLAKKRGRNRVESIFQLPVDSSAAARTEQG